MTVGTALLAVLILVRPGHAQDSALGRAPSDRARAYRVVTTACTADYARLCPDEGAAPPSARAVLLCLKFYKRSLAAGCRRSVNAALAR